MAKITEVSISTQAAQTLFVIHICDSIALRFEPVKHGAILYNEAEVFSLSIRNPNGRPMLQFDWLIYSSLILARSRCPKILQSDQV